MANIIVDNFILSIETHQSLDLQEISDTFPEAVYEPENLPAVLFRYENPIRLIFITSYGKLVCTGSKTEDQATETLSEIIGLLKENNFIDETVSIPFQVDSLVVSKNLNIALPLERIHSELPSDQCSYDASTYPWLEYRQDKYSMLLFSSGIIVCTGAVSLTEARDAFNQMEDILTSIGCEITE